MELNVGERLRTLREMYGMSQRGLAKKAGVTNGIISMIEKNRNSPSLATLKKILDAIPMPLSEFFSEGEDRQLKTFYKAADLSEIGSSGFSFRQVGGDLTGRAMQILHERIEAGADSGAEMLRHESEEGGVVIRGHIELTVGGETQILEAGDAYYFDSRIPHRFRNIGQDDAEIISTCSPPAL
jgi:transcriptional regulator with XRE-family HTH domain